MATGTQNCLFHYDFTQETLKRGDKNTLGTLRSKGLGLMGKSPRGYGEEEKRESDVLVCSNVEKRRGSLFKKSGTENLLGNQPRICHIPNSIDATSKIKAFQKEH